jgi:hypothetical protein
MARHKRASKIENRTARLKLAVRRKPYFVPIAPRIGLGYRRNQTAGAWVVRAADGHGGNWTKVFAIADDHEETNGERRKIARAKLPAAVKLLAIVRRRLPKRSITTRPTCARAVPMLQTLAASAFTYLIVSPPRQSPCSDPASSANGAMASSNAECSPPPQIAVRARLRQP